MDPLQGEALDRRMDTVLDYLGAYFMEKSPVHAAAEDIARRLDEAGIDYAIAGAVSLAVHGFVRATEDVAPGDHANVTVDVAPCGPRF